MAINPQGRKMTVEEYFQLDSDPAAKYEYIEGYAVINIRLTFAEIYDRVPAKPELLKELREKYGVY